MLSKRTKISLCQLLAMYEPGLLKVLFEKRDLSSNPGYYASVEEGLLNGIAAGSEAQLSDLLNEVVRTRGDLRSRANPKYRFDERWEDLCRCLELEGYRVDATTRALVPLDPTIPGAAAVEDDLSSELNRSGLPESEAITGLMEGSANAFRRVPPDYNGALTDARVTLETLAKGIAAARLASHPGTFDPTKWGQTLSYLRTSGLLAVKQEAAIAGVYSFVSEGAHAPVGFTEEEMVRLGRSLVASLLYFLIKLYNSNH